MMIPDEWKKAHVCLLYTRRVINDIQKIIGQLALPALGVNVWTAL